MLTQVVRYGRHMLKANIHAIRCHVKVHFSSSGSALRGTIGSTCHAVETRLEIESDDFPELIAAVIHNAEAGCYARAAMEAPVPVTSSATLNGQEFDYRAYPKAPPRRR